MAESGHSEHYLKDPIKVCAALASSLLVRDYSWPGKFDLSSTQSPPLAERSQMDVGWEGPLNDSSNWSLN